MKKKKINKKMIIGLAFFVLFSLIVLHSSAFANSHFYEENQSLRFHGGRHPYFLKHHSPLDMAKTLIKLDITDQQKTEIADIIKANRSVFKTVHKSAKNSMALLVKEVTADTFNEQAIRSASQQLTEYMEEGIVIKAQILSQIKSILTDEQKEILLEKRLKLLESIRNSKKPFPHQEISETLDLWIDKHSSR